MKDMVTKCWFYGKGMLAIRLNGKLCPLHVLGLIKRGLVTCNHDKEKNGVTA
jgi:hypothetical protein